MEQYIGYGAGKLILCGEHAVVYGEPAVAMAVDVGTTVTMFRSSDSASAKRAKAITSPALPDVFAEMLQGQQVKMEVTSDLPIGRGMGSSGALSVAFIRALAQLNGGKATFNQCVKDGYKIEKHFHGNPSGLDHTVSAHGGVLQYKNGQLGGEFSPLPSFGLPLVVMDTGIKGDTSAAVNSVAQLGVKAHPHIRALGKLSLQLCKILQAQNMDTAHIETAHIEAGGLSSQALDICAVADVFNSAQHHLRAIGVSHPITEGLIDIANQSGALGAKISGAGCGGVVIAITPEPSRLVKHLKSLDFNAFVAHCSPREAF